MKRSEIIKINLILMFLMLVVGYGIMALIGFIMNLSIPIPVLIIIFCYVLYIILKNVIERRI
ncbi:MAG: hypothetical protein IJ629_06180 [Clostridia bacterium]|nr:hypothetical protein [Clostridia bacterium]